MKHIITNSTCIFLFLFAFNAALTAAEKNAVYEDLVNNGLPLGNGKTIKLPEPVMADGLKEEEQQAVLKKIGPKNANQMKQFSNGGLNDWFEDKQSSEKGSAPNDSIGRRIDLYFVAKGKLDKVAAKGFIKNQIQQQKKEEEEKAANPDDDQQGGGGIKPDKSDDDAKQNAKGKQQDPQSGKIDFFTPEELKARKLDEKDTNTLKERYVHGIVNLIDAVQVTGCAYAVETITPESLTIAFKIDHRFDKDPTFPNQYQLITNPGPPLQLGPAKPYTGYAAYAKVTKLQGTEDKLFVEYHILYDEPYEWFNGGANLISKLDISFKDNIRKFRRRVR
jgi:hypothetical protein